MQLDKAIQGRKSVRKFSDKKPDWRDIMEAIDAARYAPMAGDNFTLKFILVDDKEKIKQLAEFADQDFIQDVHYVVIVCTNNKRTTNAYGKRGEIYCMQQAGAAIQNFLLKIEELKLDTCWIGHFLDNKIKKFLKIPEDINIEAFFPIGYKQKEPKRKPKISMDSIMYFNEFKKKKMNTPSEAKEFS